jgi:hypothetical protein
MAAVQPGALAPGTDVTNKQKRFLITVRIQTDIHSTTAKFNAVKYLEQ